MENATCHVIVVDKTVREDRLIRVPENTGAGHSSLGLETSLLDDNVGLLLDVFGDGQCCLTSATRTQV
jgi:hypothetical protein